VSSITATPLLVAEGVTKRFAGITALSETSLHVDEGEIVGLIGPNGAGKTTLFDCIYGVLRPDGGRVTFKGQDLLGRRVHLRARLGMGRTFQRIELFTGTSVRDHLLVAERSRAGTGGLLRDLRGKGGATDEEIAKADEVLELVGLSGYGDKPIESLSLGKARLVELGRALMIDPDLLLLDEPSSGLDGDETTAMGEVLTRVCAERGVSVLLVEHDVELVRSVTTRLYVLDFGTLIAEGPTADVLGDEAVRKAYLGST
jgi:branched-chain amino acid transport system ATP-binding protein